MLTVLEIATRALRSPGMMPPRSLLNPGDDLGSQALSLLYDVAADMKRRHDWQELTTEAKLLSKVGDDQGNIKALLPDFRHWINNTLRNNTTGLALYGPVSAQTWQNARNGLTTLPAANAWRQRGNHLLILGQNVADQEIVFEYVSNNWLQSANGLDKLETIKSDKDVCLLPEDVVINGLRWRWQESKGFDYSEAFRFYETAIVEAKGRNSGAATLSLVPRANYGIGSYPFDIAVKI
jgi:hypothetical protein